MDAYVTTTIKDAIATIEFYHHQSNSLPSAILTQLTTAIVEAGSNIGVKVIVLQSSGDRTFCAGASFDELIAISNEAEGLHFFSGFAHVINAMRRCPKFIICRVQGKAIGGGVGLACAADYTMATQYAQVKLSELAVGIGPFVVGPAVERKIGTSAAYELAIDAANLRTAQWAYSKGMYTVVTNTIAELDVHIQVLATTLTKYNAEAMASIKAAFWQGTAHWEQLLYERAAVSGKLVLSEHTKAAISAFKTK